MKLKIAQNIIKQEALLPLIANPNLEFDINNGRKLRKFFEDNESDIVTACGTIYWPNGVADATHSCFTFKIDHPKHGIGYYNTMQTAWDERRNLFSVKMAGPTDPTATNKVNKWSELVPVMDLKTAQMIIDQEAAPILITNPIYKFYNNELYALIKLFKNNKSKVISIVTTFIDVDMNGGDDMSFIVLKIDHPEYGICYYHVDYNCSVFISATELTYVKP